MPRLCTTDQQQLQALQDGCGNNLHAQPAGGGQLHANCMAPGARAGRAGLPDQRQAVVMDIIALALACDLTRVCEPAVLDGDALPGDPQSGSGSNQTDTHHDYSHNGPTSFYSLGGMCVGSYDNMGHQKIAHSDIYSPSNTNLYQNLSQQEAIDQFYAVRRRSRTYPRS